MVTAATPFARTSSLAGRPVLTEGGSSNLEVQDLVLGSDGRTVDGFTLREPGLLGHRHVATVPMERVTSIGPDAVVVADDDFDRTSQDPHLCADVVGVSVMTVEGVSLGTVTDVVVRTHEGTVRVEAVEVRHDGEVRYVVLDDATTIGADALVVPKGGERRLLEDPEAVAQAVEGTSPTTY